MAKCFLCRHWTLKTKHHEGYESHGMARFGFGFCAKNEIWEFYPPTHECQVGKFEKANDDVINKRKKWLEGK